VTPDALLKQAQEELWKGIQAIEDGDLPFARSSAQRAASMVTEAWQKDRRTPVDPKQ
jgi:hypothetical protein